MKSRMNEYPTSIGNPVDRTAKSVISGGTHYVPNKKIDGTRATWDTPQPTIPCPLNVQKWIGTVHDRMKIVGLFARHPKNGWQWLAKCFCGKYEIRNHMTWRKPRDVYIDSCEPCRFVEQQKRAYGRELHFRTTGEYPKD